MSKQFVRPGSSTTVAVNDVISIITPQGQVDFTGTGSSGTGLTIEDVLSAIAAAALESTDDLPEGTLNKYFTAPRVSYTHNQNAVSNSWVINHNLGFKPNVTVQDSAGTTYEGEINHTSANSLTVSFSAAFSGKAYLS
jgi:hypothetical protein